MKKKLRAISCLALAYLLLLSSCKKFEAGEDNEEEVITTMNLYFTPANGGAAITFSFDDVDGPGGIAPTQSTIALAANTIYNVRLELLNKTVSPADTITNEVIKEAAAHRFYYTPYAGNAITVSNPDTDANGGVLGINSRWTTGAPSTGTVTVTLRHYPGTPPDKQDSDPVTSPKSSTDIAIAFNFTIN